MADPNATVTITADPSVAHAVRAARAHPYSRGWRSTKLHLALITMALITGVYVLAGFPAGSFEALVWGLLGAAGIYSGAATAEKFTRPPAN